MCVPITPDRGVTMLDHRYVAGLVALVLAPLAVHAQKDVASCKPLLDALAKQATTPFHGYVTTSTGVPGGKPRQDEMISVGGVHYFQIQGKWMRSKVDAAALAQQGQENMRTATAVSCRRVRDEPVGGVSAVVYSTHLVNEGITADGMTWIAQGTGLTLRTESDIDTGDKEKSHMSSRYEYTNVHAPAVAE
jgi:hypothetical protein